MYIYLHFCSLLGKATQLQTDTHDVEKGKILLSIDDMIRL